MVSSLSALIELLDLEELEVNIFRGVSPTEDQQRVFGGQVAGQALVAAGRTVDKGEADKLMKDSDAGRADYFLRFFKIERELPTHYDLVVNTDKLTPEEATDIVAAAAKRKA